ncbi:MAG TPA: DUF1003 domain-containing protein [Anaerolineae bacterium]|nr:DUF1003 domain-containing protein [Anaerolineae bacterium]
MSAELELLSDVTFFESLDADERAELSRHIDYRHYPAGATIFRYGEPGGAMYVIRNGEVELWLTDEDHKRVVLGTFGSGEFFGELSLLDEEPRAATATTLSETDLLVVDREDLQLLFAKKPSAALDVLSVLGKRLRQTNEIVRTRAARNVNEMFEEKLTVGDRLADWLTTGIGSMGFVYLNAAWFGVWIVINLGLISGLAAFDPFPFGLLTMVVSLEAIFLSLFVLISQNRADAKDRLRSELDYRVNVKAELEIGELHDKVDRLRDELLGAIGLMSKHLTGTQDE